MNSDSTDSANWRNEFDAAGLALLTPTERAEFNTLIAPSPEFRGAAAELMRSDRHEILLAGPAETGKSFACLWHLDRRIRTTPGAQAVLVRKVRDTIYSTILQTYTRKVLPLAGEVEVYGGQRPQWFDYPNGGRLWLAGLDDPGKVLSSELDFVCANQAEELTEDDWQVLTTRATGRAGHTTAPQVFGDCNPGPPHHWIRNRPSLKLLESRHEDNPSLWDAAAGEWTEQGRRTLAVLDALTGVRRERLRFGRWVSAEGTVYQFDANRHLIDPFPIPPSWPRFRAIDFGYSNPFCCLWLAIDPDGRLYVYREIYITKRTVREHALKIKSLDRGESISATVADHDAGDRATLAENGIHTLPAEKAISRGIQAVEDRLKNAGDGRPRLFLFRDALVERDESLAAAKQPVCLRDEFDVYAWPKDSDGKAVKETPVDLWNHASDALRYAVMYANGRASSPVPKLPSGSTRLVPALR
jgi:PBSX family phage terminase large subunit